MQEQQNVGQELELEKKMKNLRNLLVAVTLMGILMINASTVRAGLLVSDFTGGSEETPCTEIKEDSKYDWGVIINGITGVIINGFTGVIINDATVANSDCGVIING